MMTLLHHTWLRWACQGAALIFTFSLGIWVRGSFTETPTEIRPAPSLAGRLVTVPVSSAKGKPASPLPQPAARFPQAMPSYAPATQRLQGPNGRLATMLFQVEQLDQAQALDALHRVDQMGGAEARTMRQLLVARFAELDPETALTYVDTLTGDEHGAQSITALSAWASRDPQAAARHLDQELQTRGLATDDDADAVAAIASEWSQRDPQAAWNWVASLPQDARAEAINRLALDLASANPTTALRTISSLPDSYDRAAALQPITSKWAETSPAQAAAWVPSLPTQEEQASAATGLVTTWMRTNPTAVSSWILTLPASATRDAAVAAMVNAQSIRNDPESATLWAATVQDTTLRQQLVTQHLKRWQQHDAAAASRWAGNQ